MEHFQDNGAEFTYTVYHTCNILIAVLLGFYKSSWTNYRTMLTQETLHPWAQLQRVKEWGCNTCEIRKHFKKTLRDTRISLRLRSVPLAWTLRSRWARPLLAQEWLSSEIIWRQIWLNVTVINKIIQASGCFILRIFYRQDQLYIFFIFPALRLCERRWY